MVKIATKVYKEETLSLQNEQEVKIRPLPIKYLREFMKEVDKLTKLDDPENESIDIMFNACIIALKRDNPEIAKDTEMLEENLDVPTMHKIFEVAGGIKLGGDVPN